MKKKLTRFYSLFWALLAGYLFLSFDSNPPNGYTSSPPSFNTCASSSGGCHSGGGGTGDISISGLPANIDPNTTYPITVTVSRSNGVPQKAGFQMNVLNSNNNNFGTLSNAGPGSAVEIGYFEHSPAQPFGGNSVTYTVDWTSPSTGNTSVTMYAAANLANGDNNTSGDAIVTTQAFGNFVGSAGPITVVATGTDVSCFGANDGTATASPSGGGGGPYTFSWSNGMSGMTISGLAPGLYTVTVTNANGDPGMGSVTINQPPAPLSAVILNTIDITCLNPVGSVTADGSGGTPGYSFNWSNGMSGPTINVTSGGNFTVTVTDANQCMASTLAVVSENTTPPSADAGPPMVISCSVPTATLDGTNSSTGGNISYAWTTLDGNIVSGGSTATPTVDAGGNYNLTVTDNSNGCFATDATTVVENINLPIAQIAPPPNLDCNNSSVMLDGTGSSTGPDFSYLWTTANGNIVSGATTLTPTVDVAGNYILTVTDNTSGCSSSTSANVISNATLPTASAGADMSLNCNNTSVVLNGSASSSGGGITYFWTTTGGNIVSGETTTMPTVDAAGTYTLTVTNSNNSCSASDVVEVTQTPVLSASISSTTNVDCFGNSNGSATAAGNGGNGSYSYAWSNGQMTQTIMNQPMGSYIITVTDADNCTSTATATISEPPALTANVTTMDESAPGAGDGSATANPMGGTGPFSYLWNINETTQTISNLAAGTYTVTVTDANGCTTTGSGTVNNFDCSGLTATASTVDVTCNGGSDGSATATPSGGSMPYNFEWSDGQTTQTASGLTASTYTVTVADNDGCEEVIMVTVSQPTAVTISVNTVDNVSCNGGMDGAIDVGAAGGNGGFSFVWSNAMMGSMIGNLAAGPYTVTATDMEGCEGTLSLTVTEPSLLTLTSSQITGALCNGESTGSATMVASGGTPNYTYMWPGGSPGPTCNNLSAGTYTPTVTDANGCTATMEITISEPPAVVANVSVTGETAVGANDGAASSAPVGGTGGYTFIWDIGLTTATISNLLPGDYCVTVSDDNGCTAEECVTVNAFACAGISTMTSGGAVSCFGGNDGTATVTPAGFTDPITYAWSNGGATASISGLIAGTYSVTVTGVDGCSTIDEYEVESPSELTVNSTSVTNAECPDSANGAITVAGDGGTPDYTYAWLGGPTGATIDGLASGSYTVVVTDANGCTANQTIDVAVDPDTELPNVVLQDITVELDSSGMVTITPDMVDNGSTDNCGIDTMILDISTFTCDDLGDNEVVLAVADLSNNCGFDMATVTVVDNIAPSIACPDNITVQSTNCEEIVDYGEPTLDDNCPNPTFELVGGSPPGSTFPSGTTTIMLEAMDASGNTANCSFSIIIDNGFSGTAIPTNALCSGDENGEATATPMGGQAPFSYLWSDDNGQMSQTATGLGAGTYTVTITDNAGCQTTASAIVDEPDPLVITVDSVINEILTNMDGAIDVTISGGTSLYTYVWSMNGNVISNEEDPTGLSAGDYSLVITDANGCIMETGIITVSMINSTLNPALERFVDIYPNPATGNLFLQFDLPTTSEISISLFNLNGKLARPTLKDYFSKKAVSLELNDFSAGLYIVRIVIDDEVLVKRIVVSD